MFLQPTDVFRVIAALVFVSVATPAHASVTIHIRDNGQFWVGGERQLEVMVWQTDAVYWVNETGRTVTLRFDTKRLFGKNEVTLAAKGDASILRMKLAARAKTVRHPVHITLDPPVSDPARTPKLFVMPRRFL